MLLLLVLAAILSRLIQYSYADLDSLPDNAIAVIHDSFFTKREAQMDIEKISDAFGTVYVIDKQSKQNMEGFLEREDGKPLYEPILLYRNDAAGGIDPMDNQFSYNNAVEFILLKSITPDPDLLLPFVSEFEVEEKAREIDRIKGNITRRHIKLVKEGKMSEEHIVLFTPPQLFFFEGSDCEPCAVLKYQYMQYVTRRPENVVAYVVNCDVHTDFCRARGITRLPALRMYAKKQWFTYKPSAERAYSIDDFVKHNAVKEEDIAYAREVFNIPAADQANTGSRGGDESKGKDTEEVGGEDTKEEKPKNTKKRPVPVYRNVTDVGGDDLRRSLKKAKSAREALKKDLKKEL